MKLFIVLASMLIIGGCVGPSGDPTAKPYTPVVTNTPLGPFNPSLTNNPGVVQE